MSAAGPPEAPPRSFWVALAPGAAMTAFGARSLVVETGPDGLASAVRWLAGGNLAHVSWSRPSPAWWASW